MVYFLTSSTLTEDGALNPANGFVAQLRKYLSNPCKGLFICSSPDNPERTERHSRLTRESFERVGFSFKDYQILDRASQSRAAELVGRSGLIVLSGGHVPTQNRFFHEIGLGELLRGFDGVLVGVSAGSMNAAETVYAHVELPGETNNPQYQRFLPGLGLTKTMILPHYQAIRNDVLDGLRVMEDVAYPDSIGRCFYALVDGSYVLNEGGGEILYGEAYRIKDGTIEKISDNNEKLPLPRS